MVIACGILLFSMMTLWKHPLFINNNLIIALALLVVFVHPTGRWLGLDALLCRLIFGPEKAAAPTAVV